MKKDTPVALKNFPDRTGKVTAVDGDAAAVRFDDDSRIVRHEIAELVELQDTELPDGDDKSWPPPGMETKTT